MSEIIANIPSRRRRQTAYAAMSSRRRPTGLRATQLTPSSRLEPRVTSCELIDWSELGKPDGRQQLSLTVTFELPAGGGGLYVWNVNRLEIEHMSPAERRAHTAANRHATLTPYTVGNLVIHSGHQLHQIAPLHDPQPNDRRITLQAHALPVDSRWIIYW
jgi:hypothetical protein